MERHYLSLAAQYVILADHAEDEIVERGYRKLAEGYELLAEAERRVPRLKFMTGVSGAAAGAPPEPLLAPRIRPASGSPSRTRVTRHEN